MKPGIHPVYKASTITCACGASAVTLIFVAVCAAYLGALDGAFNWLIKQII